jgi:hypothetical protein
MMKMTIKLDKCNTIAIIVQEVGGGQYMLLKECHSRSHEQGGHNERLECR